MAGEAPRRADFDAPVLQVGSVARGEKENARGSETERTRRALRTGNERRMRGASTIGDVIATCGASRGGRMVL
eukprot:3466889-Rhodomonas_salina.3